MNAATAENHRNPFPGLRPFREDEEYLFFGRENQVDAMVDKLAATHFLAVVGTSGSGKSSLVNCGLRPALHGGLMARAGTSWRMAQFRPGNDPMRAMARALAEDGVLFRDYQAGGLTLAEIVDTTLRMSKLGLIDIYEQANLGEDVNLLVVADQFEELFRYRQPAAGQQQNVTGVIEEATAFVNLLLAAKEQTSYPIHIVLTMRSDFLGDCAQFPGLAEAINAGQYLVPRMTRDERRAAISGPVGVGGAEISPVLLTRLVNDVGDNPDQLSILQHALNRTWSQWERSGDNGPLDLPHYQAIGTMAHALDQHAEKAYAQLTTARQRQICEKLFKALTDKATDPRGVRRPTRLDTLCALAEATPAEVTQVIDVFRKPSRSFLMPPAEDTLEAETVIDISHESLMRVWERLKTWADQEAQSAHIYSRLAETAVLHAEGKAALWDDPDLQVALDWQEKNRPNKDWAWRYDQGFDGAITFLQESKEARDAEVAEIEFGRKMRKVRNVVIGLVLTLLLWDPLQLTPPGPLTYEVPADVRKKLEQANILTLPESITDSIAAGENEYSPTTEEAAAVNKALDEERNKEHIAAVLKGSFVKLPDAVILGATGKSPKGARDELMNTLQKKGAVSVVAVWYETYTSNVLSQHIDLKKKGIAILPYNEFPPNVVFEPLYAVPDSVKVVAGKQTGLIALALKTPWRKESLLRQPQALALAGETFRLLVHLLGYLALLFVGGAIYRRFAFDAIGSAGESALSQSPWWIRWRAFQVRAHKLLDRFQSPRWKFVFSVSLLLAGVIFFVFGLLSFVRDSGSVLRHGVPIGLILILLVRTDGILKRSWTPRFKVAQGILLKVGGVYSLIGLFYLFFSMDAWGPGLLLVQNRLVLALAGTGLVILGQRRRELTAEDTLAREPDRAPVLHFRLFEGENQNQKETWVAWIRRYLWPNDEQILRPIFGVLGPFATFAYREELSESGAVYAASAISNDLRPETTELMRRSAFVILQIDNRLTDGFLSQMRQTFQTLRPDQVLVYFSQKIEATKLNETYRKFVEVTRDVFPGALPPSIDSNRFLAFDDGWQPFLCGPLTFPKFWWGKLMPLPGHRLEAARSSRAISRALRPFFERRNLVKSDKKLYGDRAIGFSAIIFFDLGLPAGVMIFRNLWCMRRRWVAPIGLFAPPVGIVVALYLGIQLLGQSLAHEALMLESTALVTMVLFGFPFATYWFWRRLSGREIRQHLAFGGSTQPIWKVILVLLIAGGWWLALVLFVMGWALFLWLVG
jgi:conflict system STAND superfamily ATPase